MHEKIVGIVNNQHISFSDGKNMEITLEKKAVSGDSTDTSSRRKFGCMKGIVKYMAEDFDAPLEDFAEYM